MRYYSLEPSPKGDWNVLYDRKRPPNSSVTEIWLTVGLEHDGARITFLEYIFEDDDPDGVREAFGCKYESIYRLTSDTSEAGENKLFAYTVNDDGSITRDLSFDIDKARAIYLFIEPQDFSDEVLLSVTEAIEGAPYYSGVVEEILMKQLLKGRDDVVCFSLIKNRH